MVRKKRAAMYVLNKSYRMLRNFFMLTGFAQFCLLLGLEILDQRRVGVGLFAILARTNIRSIPAQG